MPGAKYTEGSEQELIIQWADYMSIKHPELAMLFHIPNGGKRDARTAAILKRQGVKAGVPDLFLPVPRGGYHGLFIELKAKGGRLSDHQERWIKALTIEGYKAIVCYGHEEATEALANYIRGR